MSSRPKTHPQACPTRRTLRYISSNWRKCTRLRRESLSNSHARQYFSPASTSSKFHRSMMPRPTHRKTTKTMAPRRRSTPSHPLRNHFRKKPWWPLPRLQYTHTLRPATPLFKRKMETSQTSVYLAP